MKSSKQCLFLQARQRFRLSPSRALPQSVPLFLSSCIYVLAFAPVVHGCCFSRQSSWDSLGKWVNGGASP